MGNAPFICCLPELRKRVDQVWDPGLHHSRQIRGEEVPCTRVHDEHIPGVELRRRPVWIHLLQPLAQPLTGGAPVEGKVWDDHSVEVAPLGGAIVDWGEARGSEEVLGEATEVRVTDDMEGFETVEACGGRLAGKPRNDASTRGRDPPQPVVGVCPLALQAQVGIVRRTRLQNGERQKGGGEQRSAASLCPLLPIRPGLRR